MTKKLKIFTGGLGSQTIQNWQGELSNTLYLDTHDGEFHKFPEVTCISANSHGAGGDFDLGASKFQKIKSQVSEIISQYDLVLIVAGFGGGTGSSFTTELVKLCNDQNKLKIVIGNSLKYEEYFQDVAQFNYELVTDSISDQSPYLILDSEKIENYLSQNQLQKKEYEKQFSILVQNLSNSIDLLLSQGIDIADIQSILTNGKLHFAISENLDSKSIVKNLLDSNFLLGNTNRINQYCLLYPKNIEQAKFEKVLGEIESKLRIKKSKLRSISNNNFVFIGSQQTVTNTLQTPQSFVTNSLFNQQIELQPFVDSEVTNTNERQTNDFTNGYKHLDRQEFLDLIWEDKKLENLSLGEVEKFVNSNLEYLQIEYGVTLESEMTKSAVNTYKNKIKK